MNPTLAHPLINRILPRWLAAAFLLAAQAISIAQGPLVPPPGPPGPTMKSLDQVEARTPIGAAPYTITAAGSYYLTKNLSVSTGDAIIVGADDVTLDLNGFAISSSADPFGGNGVFLVEARKNVRIYNGTIRSGGAFTGGVFAGTGFQGGIEVQPGNYHSNIHVSSVSVIGCRLFGIHINNISPNLVESCVAMEIGGVGISGGTVVNCRVENAHAGISGDIVSRCHAISLGGHAIYGSRLVEHSHGQSTGGSGIYSEKTAIGCSGTSSTAPGVRALTAMNCHGESTSSQGILVTNATNCFGTSGANRGIDAQIATGCVGTSFGGSFGLIATRSAHTSHGVSNSGTGLSAPIVNTCTGESATGIGLSATYKYNTP